MRGELDVGAVVSGARHTYSIERELGRGGFGVTFFARREGDGLGVALKSLHIKRLKEWKSYELFQRETAVLRRLDHPSIPDYVDDFGMGEDPKAPEGLVLVQQFVDGYPLSEVVRGNRSLDEGQMVAWLAQILEVLDYLHHLSPPVIHRDITPKNIMIRPADQAAFLVDFGTVQAAIRSASEVTSTSAGTFGYAPMEQFVSAAFPASDLYGLGMTCLAVASGCEPSQMPFKGLRVDVQTLTSFDARLTLLLQRMTEPDPERRLGDARIALEQLRPLLSRYASDRGVAAEAIQKVAESHPAKAGTRTSVSNHDLLPSERIREAAVRLEQLDGRTLSIQNLDELIQPIDSQALVQSPDHAIAKTRTERDPELDAAYGVGLACVVIAIVLVFG